MPGRSFGKPPLAPYDRERELPRLLLLWPQEIRDTSHEGRVKLVAALRKTLREERRRGIAGHWTYDLARHVQLLRAYRTELALLRGRPAERRAEPCG